MNATTIGSKKNSTVDMKAIFERIRANPRIIFIVAAAISISIIIALLLWARTPNYRVLYSNISEQDGGAIVTQLTQMQVPYQFAEHNGAIMVPEDKVYEVRLKLAQQGLPKGGAVGFELLDQERFGISQFSEQVNFQRALEGELSRTIETLGPVQSARIHLAMPKPSLFIREQKEPTASVTLTLQSGRALGDGQVNAIAYMIASAVPGLSADNVTIVDQAGHLLTQNGAQSAQTTELKYTQHIESDYQNRIQAILAPVVGSQNVRTEVTAQIDFTQNEQTSEQYQPNSSPDKMAIRSQQSSRSEQGGKSGVGGVPGALSNQPPEPATAPIVRPVNSTAGQTTSSGKNTSQAAAGNGTVTVPYNQHQDDTTNYELDRTLTHIKHDTGTVQRLSVAVVVNYLPGKDGQSAALTKAQMDQINALVKEAMGYSSTRGDTLNVVNTPFSTQDHDAAIPLWKQPDVINLLLEVVRYLVVAVIAWVLWRKAVQPFWHKHKELELQRLTMVKEAREAEMDAQRRKKESNELAKAQLRMDAELSTQNLREMAEQEPQIIALVIRQWMNKEQMPS
ncbi:Flagellar M-ring protein [Enterobacter sp. DC4]|uniref:flagellar basal-body MS-ring/collar protein FliF n=1 Tax=Enterobacter sp. DC4 TaxID=1395580 RepID=UPI0003ED1660|nr:flagellar basal-body MS-ring/collar protein FliF [Enterobacter sp. DC4]EWG67261.1 Flagellar M-ring protein [Enterobacter sp. DC4]